ncbi:cytochrome c family protein [Thiohalocapsa marina]|uniref:cytochrome c family protein n=1 Tax=Thiohalocapsa marina TaxID=424902 RepID=UPI0036DBF66E|nr:cytochrome c family protein [Sphingobacteriia bacterium]NCC41070.1 cytochrome c family protein [Gammaproteobacteria bacterium]
MRLTLARLSISLGLALTVTIFSTAVVQAEEAAEPIHKVSSEVCQTCHEEIYRQWKGSMHANSTALSDPIHGAFYQMEVGDPRAEGQVHKKSGTFPICLQCHAPNAARDQTTKLDAHVAYSEGVNCVACHTLQKYNGIQGEDGKMRLGLKAYELSDNLQGPAAFPRGLQQLAAASDDLFGGAIDESAGSQKPNPHLGEPVEIDGIEIPALTMEASPILMKTSDACMGCHDQRNNPQNVPLCATGNEFIESGSKVACQSCHMPVSGGLVDHSMGGGHSPEMLKRAVVFDVQSTREGDLIKTKIFMQNAQPHSIPTGAPFRNMFIKLTAYDEQGEIVWQNAAGHPSKDDPQAYFHYGLADDKGMPAPPPTATQLGNDTRLKPHETRELLYEIPADGVVLVRGELYYNLLWQSLVEKFKDLPTELTEPVLMAAAEQRIDTP